MNNYKTIKYNDNYRTEILSIWENSVLATHDFLTSSDFEENKALVKSIDFNDFQVFCLSNERFS